MNDEMANLIIQIESLKLRLEAIEKALPNIVGFHLESADGSEQGRIKFDLSSLPVDAKVVGAN